MELSKAENLRNFKLKVCEDRFLKGVPKDLVKTVKANSVYEKNINEVGYIGEQMYYAYLLTILEYPLCEVTWINQTEEKGLPYDFTVLIGDKLFYIDVKSTKGTFSNDIYISKKEYAFALNTPTYFIARLYEWETDKGKLRAGNFNVSLQTLDSVLHLLKFN